MSPVRDVDAAKIGPSDLGAAVRDAQHNDGALQPTLRMASLSAGTSGDTESGNLSTTESTNLRQGRATMPTRAAPTTVKVLLPTGKPQPAVTSSKSTAKKPLFLWRERYRSLLWEDVLAEHTAMH